MVATASKGSLVVDARQGLPGAGGKTALHLAAMGNNMLACEQLLLAGAGGLRRVRGRFCLNRSYLTSYRRYLTSYSGNPFTRLDLGDHPYLLTGPDCGGDNSS